MIAEIIITVLIILLIWFILTNSDAKLPDGVANGDVIRCAATGGIYKIENGTKRWYPNMEIYTKHGQPEYKSANCAVVSNIPAGPHME